jgi:hypothetical protein
MRIDETLGDCRGEPDFVVGVRTHGTICPRVFLAQPQWLQEGEASWHKQGLLEKKDQWEQEARRKNSSSAS